MEYNQKQTEVYKTRESLPRKMGPPLGEISVEFCFRPRSHQFLAQDNLSYLRINPGLEEACEIWGGHSGRVETAEGESHNICV